MADKEEKIVPEKEEAVKEEKAKKKLGKGALAGIIVAALVVVAAVAFFLVVYLAGTNAVTAYNAKDYEKAYESTKMALFLDEGSKNLILEKYITKTLCAEGKYYTAAKLLEESTISDKKKASIYEDYNNLALCKKGATATFASWEQDGDFANGKEDLDWLVLDIVEENGRAKALLMTTHVIGNSEGWNHWDKENSTYVKSGLHAWCETDFYGTLKMDTALKDVILETNVVTEDSSTGIDSGEDVKAHAFAPSKQELEKYLTGDLASYLIAQGTKAVKESGITINSEGAAGYFLRNAGKDKNTITAVDRTGAILEDLSKEGQMGVRVCLWIDLGEI